MTTSSFKVFVVQSTECVVYVTWLNDF